MSLYPSLEDMKVDQLSQAQVVADGILHSQHHAQRVTEQELPYPLHPHLASAPLSDLSHLYPTLDEYMGLEFTPEVIAANMPEYLPLVQRPSAEVLATSTGSSMIAPLSGSDTGLQRAQVSHGIREVSICKDAHGKVGIRVKDINKGIFICLVKKGSPAALAGLRFGDQILQMNGQNVAAFSVDKVHDIFRKAPVNGIVLAIRDRPFERTITLHKDSTGHIGFQFRDGEITALVKDSSAARNGLLTEHHLLEVNGQNVVGLKDKDVSLIIGEVGHIITVTVMPSFVFKHMMKNMSFSLVTKMMDHSVPDL